jgi:2,4-dichlorophenol 6-monooxygenase
VHNLAWKLAAVIRGETAEALLDSYSRERRPVAIRNAEQSLRSFFDHAQIDDALGLSDGGSAEAGWAELAVLFSSTPAAEKKRRKLIEALSRKRCEFGAHNLEIGFRYDSGALVPEEVVDSVHDPISFEPSARPGARMPHVWLGSPLEARSTYEIVNDRNCTLFVGDRATDWASSAATIRSERNLALDIVVVGGPGGLRDESGEWARQTSTTDTGAVLVRPDHHVAWRSPGAVENPLDALRSALNAVLPPA